MDIKDLDILLVEDDDEHAEIIEYNLRKSSLISHIDRVDNGEEALHYLRRENSYAEKQPPSVVLLDLNMPRMNGHEVLLEIRNDQSLKRIPVIILTTSEAELDRRLAYERYANAYLVKPFNFDEFEALVNDLANFWGKWNKTAH